MIPVTGTFSGPGQSPEWAPRTGGDRECLVVICLKFSAAGSVQAERYTDRTGWVISGGPWSATGAYSMQEYVQGALTRLNCTAVSGTIDYDVTAGR